MHKKHKHKQHRTYTRKELIRRDIIKSIALCVAVLVPAMAVVLLMDYLDTNRQDPVVDAPSQSVVEQQVTTTTTEPEKEEVTLLPLPEHTYAYVNQPICYYFMNLTGFNSLEDIQVEVETGGKGKVYEDRWEYTPNKAETISFSFTARNKNNKVISQGKSIIEVKDRSEKEELTVLVIGDSTIEAGYETEQMLELAAEDNYQLKLLGTQTAPYLKDSQNLFEGRGGWRAEHYAKAKVLSDNLNPFYNPTANSFDFAYYMESQWYTDVDCVCLQLGINDVFNAENDAQLTKSYIPKYLAYMDAIIESIHEYDPDIKIVWNLILPGSPKQEKFEMAYAVKQTADRYKRNTYLANLEIVKHAAGMENVYVASTNAVLDTYIDMAGSGHGAVHPAETGYAKIGQLLYGFIRAIN